MRIKHNKSFVESYKVYSYLPCRSELYSGIKRWFFCKSYFSKQTAKQFIAKYKRMHQNSSIENRLIFKIVWCPYPFAAEEDCVEVYNEDL